MQIPDSRKRRPGSGLGLGLRMGLWTLLVVSAVLGGLSYLQQRWEIQNDVEERDAFLGSLLAPLLANLEASTDLGQAVELLKDFRRASLQYGQADFEVELRDGQGRRVGPAVLSWEADRPRARLHSRVPLVLPALAEGHGSLSVWLDDARFLATVERRGRLAGTNLLLVLASILASLLLAEHFLVTRPMAALLRAARLAGRGHFVELERIAEKGRAPEWRALAAQLRDQGRELEDTVRQLMVAERRGSLEPKGESSSPPEPPTPALVERGLRRELTRRFLQERLKTLEEIAPGSLEAHRLAGEIWARDVPEAERLGDMDLRRRLDDAAFRVLQPDEWRRVSAFLQARTQGSEAWLEGQAVRLRQALAGIEGVEVLNRVKHAGGVYRKMQASSLPLQAVPDVFGFRVIAPGVDACYRALAAAHAAFQPEPLRFKDYITAPKSNGYQSLHTCVRAEDGQLFEIQIRTPEMHQRAEHGSAAHWQYKVGQAEGTQPVVGFWRRLWVRLSARLTVRAPSSSDP